MMNNYSIDSEEMSRIMELLFHVLGIRITFFDQNQHEIILGQIKAPCAYCRKMRKNEAFDRKCIECDMNHLAEAEKQKEIIIYHCHAGLLEGIVPLYDRKQHYLGAIVFGQVAEKENPVRGVRKSSIEEMRNIGKLLLYLSGYIRENEIIRQHTAPWGERVERILAQHMLENISLSQIARMTGCSVSYVSHNFPQVFGMSFKQYVKRHKIKLAKELLCEGRGIAEIAAFLGYYDVFHFSREFKSETGLSPKAWRESILIQQ